MLLNGLDGESLEEARLSLSLSVFHPNGVNFYYDELLDKMNLEGTGSEMILNNAAFYDQHPLVLLEEFERTMLDSYKALCNPHDFKDPQTVNQINAWVEGKTGGKITDFLDKIENDKILFLLNTLFFSSNRVSGFQDHETYERGFYPNHSDTISVEFLHSDYIRRMYKNDDFQAADLMLADSFYSMTFVMPLQDELGGFVGQFNKSSFKPWLDDLYDSSETRRFYLGIPKFSIGAKTDLKDALSSLGMASLLDSVNLDLMVNFNAPQTKISRVIHEAKITIDEKV